MTDLNEHSGIAELQGLNFWNPGEKLLSAEPAGDGNMNLVLRIITDQRSLILKQSKPFVRKYPQIPAPIERIEVEHAFLQLIAKDEFLSERAPRVIRFEPKAKILITEDLGKSMDYSSIYSSAKSLTMEEIQELIEFINRLHGLEVNDFPDNLSMRKLNHEHIFNFPFLEENGFDLDQVQEGLQDLSLPIKRDSKLKEKLNELGKRYLTKGKVLIHGDYYPGSWLDTQSGIKVIDPEFGFLGDREFDLGVLQAHLDLGQQREELKEAVISSYTHPVDQDLINQYHGVEILRRLIGIAQLPVRLSLVQKSELMAKAKALILN